MDEAGLEDEVAKEGLLISQDEEIKGLVDIIER